jgi:hypothetical protein
MASLKFRSDQEQPRNAEISHADSEEVTHAVSVDGEILPSVINPWAISSEE